MQILYVSHWFAYEREHIEELKVSDIANLFHLLRALISMLDQDAKTEKNQQIIRGYIIRVEFQQFQPFRKTNLHWIEQTVQLCKIAIKRKIKNKMRNYAHNRFRFNNSVFIRMPETHMCFNSAVDMQKYAMFGYMFDKYGHCFENQVLLAVRIGPFLHHLQFKSCWSAKIIFTSSVELNMDCDQCDRYSIFTN